LTNQIPSFGRELSRSSPQRRDAQLTLYRYQDSVRAECGRRREPSFFSSRQRSDDTHTAVNFKRFWRL
jgi:hypothetical protein